MLSTKRLLWRFGSLCQFNPLMTINTPANGVLIQSCDFARSATTKKSATKKKTTTASKSSKKKTTSKSTGKKSTKSTKSTKSKSTKSTKSSKTRKVAKKKKAVPKPKTFMQSLSKSDKKLLKKYPDPAKPKRPAPATYFLALEQAIMPTPKELGSLWRELDEASKARYKEQYSAQFPEYRDKAAEYKNIQDQSVEKWLNTIKELNNERPPRSGRQGFFKENASVFRGSRNFGENAKQVSAQWNELTEYEKSGYNAKYSELYREWKDHVQEYYEQQ